MKNKVSLLIILSLILILVGLRLKPKRTNPIIQPAKLTRVAVIGDYGQSGITEEKVANLVKGLKPNIIITTGDNNYPSGSSLTIEQNVGKYYREYILKNKFFPSLGNHDLGDLKTYLNYFSLPGNERYYDFIIGSIHFFAIDSNPDEPDGVDIYSNQANWLKNKLKDSGEKFKIVYFHHPPYSSGKNHGSTKYMQWPFKEWGVTAVITGHEHNYERIMKDIPYFVNGLGGYPARYSFGKLIRDSVIRYNDDYGAMLVEADDKKINFKFINIDNKIIDSYEQTYSTPNP